MNKNVAIIGGIIVIVLLIGGVLYAISPKGESPVATTTPTGVGTQAEAAAPTATTDSSVAATNSTAVLSGTVNPKGAFTAYWYEYGTSRSFGTNSAKQTLGSGYVATPAPGYVTGLAKDTTYFFRLVAENSLGTTEGATYSFKTSQNTPAPVGGVPTATTLAASGVERSAAHLKGQVVPNKIATKYWFEYGTTANLGSVTSLQSVGDGSVAVAAESAVNALASGTTYFYRINAQNKFGTVNGSILTLKTLGSVASAPVVATDPITDVATTTATLSGTVNPRGAATMYWFEYSTDSLLGSVLLTSTAKTAAGSGTGVMQVDADISGLGSNTTYYARLVAENSVGLVRGDKETFKTK